MSCQPIQIVNVHVYRNHLKTDIANSRSDAHKGLVILNIYC